MVADRLELLELDVEPVADGIGARLDERVASPELVRSIPGTAERDSRPCLGAFDRLVVHLDAPHAHLDSGRLARSSSPSPTEPDQSVPVTDGSDPCSVNARST